MARKVRGIRAKAATMRKLKVVAACVEASMGDALELLIELYKHATTEQKAMCQLLDSEECGELVSGDETEAEYIARLRAESDTGDDE